MAKISYHNKIFKPISHSKNGDVDNATTFYYLQEEDVVSGTYRGGKIKMGSLIAKVEDDGNLDMYYQHVTIQGEVMTGQCLSTPEILSDGRIRLHEKWQWTCGDYSEGTSIIEEIKGKN